MTTLLIASSAAALAAGGARYFYEVKIASQRADEAVMAAPEMRGVVDLWIGPVSVWRGGGRRACHLWFDEAEDFAAASLQLGELTAVESVQVLGRQLIPHATAFQGGEPDAVIEAWRRHPTLRQVLVDASVRGAPLGEPVRLYTREDLAMLQLALPDLEIVWMEVH
jgi:hypothetical protein